MATNTPAMGFKRLAVSHGPRPAGSKQIQCIMNNDTPAIEVKNLTMSYGPKPTYKEI